MNKNTKKTNLYRNKKTIKTYKKKKKKKKKMMKRTAWLFTEPGSIISKI